MAIHSDATFLLSLFDRKPNEQIRIVYYSKSNSAVSRISNSKRPQGRWSEDNPLRSERAILDAALNLVADLKEQGFPCELHHMVPVSLGGSYNIGNIRVTPGGANAMIKDNIYTESEITELCQALSKTSIGKKQGIPSWYKCSSLAEFLELASIHLNK